MTVPWSCENGRVQQGYGTSLCFKMENLKTVFCNRDSNALHGPVRFAQSTIAFDTCEIQCHYSCYFLLFLPHRGNNTEKKKAVPLCPNCDGSNKQMVMWLKNHGNLCIENQHCALGFVNVFITNAAPTCFSTYVPSSGSVFVGAALVINTLAKPSAKCRFSMHNPAMHSTSIKIIVVTLRNINFPCSIK
jgi:hypothetical protein